MKGALTVYNTHIYRDEPARSFSVLHSRHHVLEETKYPELKASKFQIKDFVGVALIIRHFFSFRVLGAPGEEK